MMSFSEFMKKTREKAGITQRKLSEETGYSIPFIGSWEQGKAYPPRKALPEIAKLLKIDVPTLEKEVLKWKIEDLKKKYQES